MRTAQNLNPYLETATRRDRERVCAAPHDTLSR
jgi:hypothetical protein